MFDKTGNPEVQGFSVLFDSNDINKFQPPSLLILGTAPSVKSLTNQQYYAHPRNVFWWIMGQLFDFDESLSYSTRQECLNKQGIVVWDVLASCERKGSLDSAIQSHSEVANDIPRFLNQHPAIRTIVCNGQKARQLLAKHHPCLFEGEYTILVMPSTSPAFAAMDKYEKLAKWTAIKPFMNQSEY